MPPRRDRQRSEAIEGPQAEPQEGQEGPEEPITQRLERYRVELTEKRALESIQEIQRELAGGARASSTALTGEEEASSVSHKRPASIDLSHSAKRALAPPIYKGTSLRELRDFLLGCEVYFGAVEEHAIHRRIAVAALYLHENVLR
jgi:hypothetical protein